MLDEKIIIKDGEFLNFENILEDGEKWIFLLNDPQIYIKFIYPVKGIKINFKIKGIIDQIFNSTVYYKKNEENYNEENKISFRLNTNRESIHQIHFFKEVDEIRFDIHDLNAELEVRSIVIEPLTNQDTALTCLKENINKDNSAEKLILLSHDLSDTGAPILAYNIAKAFKERGKEVVVLAGHHNVGFLVKKYNKINIPIIFLDDYIHNYANVHECLNYNRTKDLMGKEYVQVLLEMLRTQGYSKIITNTVVGGEFVRILKNYNFKIISLIHEMKTTIELYDFYKFGLEISRYSDYIVFPDKTVKNDFSALYPKIAGECLIRPQGVYLNKEILPNEKNDFYDYGFDIDDYIIMNSGTCELRKGIDLFVSAAIILNKICKKDVHFVWTGDFGNNKELEGWMYSQIDKAGLKTQFHFIPFIENQNRYKKLLSNVNIFWSTSREDPFPSVVLEALNYNIPVIGFKNAGGVNTMLSDDRGYLVENFNVAELAEISKSIIENQLLAIDKKQVEILIKNLNFGDYIDFLTIYTDSDMIIRPDFDFFKWKKYNIKHYYELQLPSETYSEKNRKLDNVIVTPKKNKLLYDKEIVLLDTGIGSDNVGDEIIMSYCQDICKSLFKKSEFLHIPTHIYDEKSENIESNFKILCGTNLIYKRMEDSKQFAFPNNIASMKNICLLGVGMQNIDLELEMSEYSKRLLNYMLSSNVVHSVQDNETREQLERIGITNVVNTSCPTMWGLTPEHCKKISKKKANAVITTVTDYMKDYEKDAKMLEILKNSYDEVYIWIQGQYDYEYLETITDLKEFKIIPPLLAELDKVLEKENIEYIGTRLHAGIRSLNYFNRSLIISIDNRAKAISRDTNLPIIERDKIETELLQWINTEHEINICLPMKNIEIWKKQFRRKVSLIKTKI